MKRGGFGLGSSGGPTPEEVEREAAAELRRAMAGSGPRQSYTGQGRPSDWLAQHREPEIIPDTDPEMDPEMDGPGWRDGMTLDEERRAVTDLAMQQLTERPFGSIRPEDTLPRPGGADDAEEMRNRALAQFLERQQRAPDRPVPSPRPAVVQTRSGFSVSPRITVAPTLTGNRGDLPSGPVARPMGDRSAAGRNGAAPTDGGGPDARRRPATRSAVPNRAVQRRGRARATPPPEESEARWRSLAELADLLADEVFPADTFPQLTRWLAQRTDSMVAVVLLTDDAVDTVTAWPVDDPMAADIQALAGEPLDERSSIWAVLSAGETIAGTVDDEFVMPDGVVAERDGGWAAVPLVDRTVAFGVLLIAGAPEDPISDATVQFLEDVAQRVARALFNSEEAVSSGGGGPDQDDIGDNGVPVSVRDKLTALSFVLEALEAMPTPRLNADHDRRYREITQHVAALDAQVNQFLTGRGGGRR
jgi:hypothetical protein